MNYWQLFFIAPRFWKLVPFRSGTQDREHVSKRNWELFVAAIRYLPLHVNLRGYWEILSLCLLSFVLRIQKRFRFQRLFSRGCPVTALCKWVTCRFLHCSLFPIFPFFLFALCTKYHLRDCERRENVISMASLPKHCANLRYQTCVSRLT